MLRYHHWRFAPVVAVTLVLAAVASASARPDLNLPQSAIDARGHTAATPCSEVCSGGGYGQVTHAGVTSTLTDPAVPPDAWLRSVVSAGSGASRLHDITASDGHAGRSKVVANGPSAPPVAVRAAAASTGFHWGDAGIGAGGAVAFAMVFIAGVLAVMKVRRRSTRGAAQPTT